MISHIRANLWLLCLTVLLCCVAYPLVLWGIGQTVFRDQAQGSLIYDADHKAVGSLLIAQEFKSDEYFQPRPSATSPTPYKADASGASNWGASNYLLRDRVARQLGPMVRYGKGAEKDGQVPGELVGPDIDKWFQQDRYRQEPGIVKQWAVLHSGLAEAWIKDTDGALKEQWKADDRDRDVGLSFLYQLFEDVPELPKEMIGVLSNTAYGPSPAYLAKQFFPLFSHRHPGMWLTVEVYETPDKQKRKKLTAVKEGPDIQSIFFDMWRQEHPSVALEEVPADMVTASASGLDPHITLKNAQYQLKFNIPAARAKKIVGEAARKLTKDFDKLDKAGQAKVEDTARKTLDGKLGKNLEIRLTEVLEELLTKSASAPLGGLVGVPLVNVLEVNMAMDGRIKQLLETGK